MSNPAMFKHEWIWRKNRQTCFPAVHYRPLLNHENIIVFGKGRITYNPQKTSGHSPTNSAKGVSQGTIYHGDNVRNYSGGETDRYPLTVQDFNCDRGLHPTQKPVALFEYLIRTYTNEGDMVLDNCAGSFTTAIACINTKRNYICIEKDEKYFEIGKKRIESASAQQRMF
jgi:site-specific DNA-methyltransferase (adenine-specific)